MISLPPPDKELTEEYVKAEELVAVGDDATLVVEAEDAIQAEDAGTPDVDTSVKGAPRAAFTAFEIVEQVAQVQEWLTQGKRPNQIRRLCAEEWGLKTRAAEKRMHDARRRMVADANVYDRQEKVGQMLQQLEQVLEQALQLRQGSNAIGAMRLQADLLQLLSRQN